MAGNSNTAVLLPTTEVWYEPTRDCYAIKLTKRLHGVKSGLIIFVPLELPAVSETSPYPERCLQQ